MNGSVKEKPSDSWLNSTSPFQKNNAFIDYVFDVVQTSSTRIVFILTKKEEEWENSLRKGEILKNMVDIRKRKSLECPITLTLFAPKYFAIPSFIKFNNLTHHIIRTNCLCALFYLPCSRSTSDSAAQFSYLDEHKCTTEIDLLQPSALHLCQPLAQLFCWTFININAADVSEATPAASRQPSRTVGLPVY